jgi:hypothetical protein
MSLPPSKKKEEVHYTPPFIKEWGGKSYLTFTGIRSLPLLRTRCKTLSYAS